MSINSQNTYLNIEDAHLRLRTGNVYAQGINIGGITVDTAHGLQRVSDTGNVTSNTLQFANATTAFVTTANVTVGRDLTVTGNATVSSNLTVTGNTLISDDLTVTGNAVISDDLTVTENLLVSNNLTVTGNTFYTNPAAVLVDSNVVTEYTGPHDRPPRKYPEVAMTANDNSSTSGYVADQTAFSGNADGYAYRLFDHSLSTAYQSGGSQYSSGDSTGSAQTTTATDGTTHQGVAITLDLATKIRLSYAKITSHTYYGRTPVEGTFLGSNNNSTWDVIGTFSGLSTTAAGQTHTVHISDYATKSAYRYIRLVVTKIHTSAVQNGGSLLEFRELEYYGYEEGSGSLDTTLKSVYNMPATTGTQLEVYYDAMDLADGAVTSVTDLSPNTNNGTVSGDPQVSNGAFVFDGTGDYITGTHGLSVPGQPVHSQCVWFKITGDTSDYQYISIIGTTNSTNQAGLVLLNDGTTLLGNYYGGDRVITTITQNVWYHAVLVYTGTTTDAAKYYINGVEVITTGLSGAAPITPTITGTTLRLGANTSGGQELNGSIANFRLYSKALNADQVKELYDYQKDYFLGSKSQVTLYKGHLGVGVTEPSGQLELAGDERIQEYPPRALTGYETLVEGHGVFCVYASTVRNSSWEGWEAFDKDTSTNSRWISLDTYTGTEDAYNGTARLYSSAPLGEYVILKLPYSIKLSSARVYGLSGSPDSDNNRQGPEKGQIWGSNDGVTWEHVTNYDFGDYQQDQWNEINDINSPKYYSQYGFIVTKKLNNTYTASGPTQGDYVAVTEIQYFGTPGPTTLDKGSLTLGRSLDVPRVSRYDVDTETPRYEKLVVDFDTTVNSSPTDISGKGNHGAFYNMASKYLASEKAFTFDGTDDHISTNEIVPSMAGAQSHTMSVWFKPSTVSGLQFITCLGEKDGGGAAREFSAIRINGSTLQFWTYSNDLGKNGVITAGVWHHAVAVYVGGATSQSTMLMYLNGEKITNWDQDTTNGQALGFVSPSFAIGEDIGRSNYYFAGQISNPKLYNVALEPSEVQKLYRLGRTGRSMVISDTAVGIGKVPEAQLDVRGILKASVGLFPDKPFFACEAYRYGLKDNDTTQTLYWHGGDTATLSSVGNMAGSRWKLGVLSGNHTYKTNNVQLVRVLNDSSSETSGVRVPYDGYYHLMHINRTISFNVGSSFVIYSPRHQKYIQTSMNGYRVPWGGNNPSGAAGGTNSNSVHASLYLEAGDIVIYIFHNAVIADNFLSGSYEQFVSLVML
jgi:hypothetical protein